MTGVQTCALPISKVSKPIVYEHFGGKEGLYAVIVDREMQTLTNVLTATLSDPDMHPRQLVERAALALLTYIDEHAEGFQILARDSPTTDPAGSFSSLLGDVSMRVEELLEESFRKQHIPTKGVPYYAQMLVGMTVFTGQYWADRRKVDKEQLAAYIVNLGWYGLSRMQPKPELRFEGRSGARTQERLAREREREAERGRRDDADGAAADAAEIETDAALVPSADGAMPAAEAEAVATEDESMGALADNVNGVGKTEPADTADETP